MTLIHDTILIEREIAFPVPTVFAAWRDTGQLEQWCYPGDTNWTTRIETHEFAIGGVKCASFGPVGQPPYREESRYLDIRPDQHIINSERILDGDGGLISTSLVAIGFGRSHIGCRLTICDQITLLSETDSPDQRRAGWMEVIARLEPFLTNNA